MEFEHNLGWEIRSLFPPARSQFLTLVAGYCDTAANENRITWSIKFFFWRIWHCWVVWTLRKLQEHLGANLQFSKALQCPYKFRGEHRLGVVCFSLTWLVAKLVLRIYKSTNINCIKAFSSYMKKQAITFNKLSWQSCI